MNHIGRDLIHASGLLEVELLLMCVNLLAEHMFQVCARASRIGENYRGMADQVVLYAAIFHGILFGCVGRGRATRKRRV